MNVLVHSYNILARISREQFADVKLVTECGSSVSGHRFVLSAASKRLGAMFDKHPEKNEFPIRNVKLEILVKVVDFIYLGKVDLSDNTELVDFGDCFSVLGVYLGPKVSSTIKRILELASDSEPGSQGPIKCEECDITFTNQKQLTRHKRQVHKVLSKQKISYQCENPECGEEYTVSPSFHIYIYFMILMGVVIFRRCAMQSTVSARLKRGPE